MYTTENDRNIIARAIVEWLWTLPSSSTLYDVLIGSPSNGKLTIEKNNIKTGEDDSKEVCIKKAKELITDDKIDMMVYVYRLGCSNIVKFGVEYDPDEDTFVISQGKQYNRELTRSLEAYDNSEDNFIREFIITMSTLFIGAIISD